MIIDVNAYLGHYPFRQLRHTTAAQVVEHMENHGIDLAFVSSLHAVFYRDAQRGNEELFEQIEPHSKRLVPIATANPRYVGWERDLEQSVQQGRARGIALWPEHHGYSLSDEHGMAVLRRIAELDVPVVLTQRLEDRRQRHHWDIAEDLTLPSIVTAATAHPTLKFLFSNWIGLNGTQLAAAGLRGRCLIDMARMSLLMTRDLIKLIETMQVESIAYGSHLPFDYLGPSLVKLANVQLLYPEDYEKIAWQNAAAFFKLDLPETSRQHAGAKK